jgi:hypothetical protein
LALASAALWPSLTAVVSCFFALSLTGCAAVAVLGARRPGVRAWNFVVGGLLAVDSLAGAESLLTAGTLQLNIFQLACLAGPLAVGVLNYLPTQLAPAALSLLLGCALELADLVLATHGDQRRLPLSEAGWIALTLTPWVAESCVRGSRTGSSAFDRIWRDFRNRFGLVWGQRVREQFNRSAAHAVWPIVLRWPGLRLLPGKQPPEAAEQTAMVATLRALLKRFGPAEETRAPSHGRQTTAGCIDEGPSTNDKRSAQHE